MLCLGSRGSADYPRLFEDMIVSILGRKWGVGRSRDLQMPSNQPCNLQVDIPSGNFYQTILSTQLWQGHVLI